MADLLKVFSSLIVNVKSVEIRNYIFSSKIVNLFIQFPFDFENEDITFFYMNFVKSVAAHFTAVPIDLFYNQVS